MQLAHHPLHRPLHHADLRGVLRPADPGREARPGLLEKRLETLRWLPRILLLEACILPCYLVGTLWFTAVCGLQGKTVGFFSALTLCVLPYLLPDAAKLLLAERVSSRVRKHLPALEEGRR